MTSVAHECLWHQISTTPVILTRNGMPYAKFTELYYKVPPILESVEFAKRHRSVCYSSERTEANFTSPIIWREAFELFNKYSIQELCGCTSCGWFAVDVASCRQDDYRLLDVPSRSSIFRSYTRMRLLVEEDEKLLNAAQRKLKLRL